MGQFKIEKSHEGQALLIKLAGQIDEDAAFDGVKFDNASEIVVDLNDIQSINSCGIREWIKWVRTAPRGSRLVFRRCPKVIVDQINMVNGFLPDGGQVESFYVPYYCDSTGNERMILFKEGVEFKGNELNPPSSVKDEETGEEMEMDVIEVKYFKFLESK